MFDTDDDPQNREEPMELESVGDSKEAEMVRETKKRKRRGVDDDCTVSKTRGFRGVDLNNLLSNNDPRDGTRSKRSKSEDGDGALYTQVFAVARGRTGPARLSVQDARPVPERRPAPGKPPLPAKRGRQRSRNESGNVQPVVANALANQEINEEGQEKSEVVQHANESDVVDLGGLFKEIEITKKKKSGVPPVATELANQEIEEEGQDKNNVVQHADDSIVVNLDGPVKKKKKESSVQSVANSLANQEIKEEGQDKRDVNKERIVVNLDDRPKKIKKKVGERVPINSLANQEIKEEGQDERDVRQLDDVDDSTMLKVKPAKKSKKRFEERGTGVNSLANQETEEEERDVRHLDDVDDGTVLKVKKAKKNEKGPASVSGEGDSKKKTKKEKSALKKIKEEDVAVRDDQSVVANVGDADEKKKKKNKKKKEGPATVSVDEESKKKKKKKSALKKIKEEDAAVRDDQSVVANVGDADEKKKKKKKEEGPATVSGVEEGKKKKKSASKKINDEDVAVRDDQSVVANVGDADEKKKKKKKKKKNKESPNVHPLSADYFDYGEDFSFQKYADLSHVKKLTRKEEKKLDFFPLKYKTEGDIQWFSRRQLTNEWKSYTDAGRTPLMLLKTVVDTSQVVHGVSDDKNKRPYHLAVYENGAISWTEEAPKKMIDACKERTRLLTLCAGKINGKLGLPEAEDYTRSASCTALATIEAYWNLHLDFMFVAKIHILNSVDKDIFNGFKFGYTAGNIYSAAFRKQAALSTKANVACQCGPDDDCSTNQCACHARGLWYTDGRLKQRRTYTVSECGPGCGCGWRCQQRVVQRGRQVPLILSREDSMVGWGLRTGRAVMGGEFMGEMTGEILTVEEAAARTRERENGQKFQMDILDYEDTPVGVLDAADKGNEIRFVNHSCQPNCRVLAVYHPGLPMGTCKIALFSLRAIKSGEPLTYNYYVNFTNELRYNSRKRGSGGKKENYYNNMECRCGAPKRVCIGNFPTPK